MVTPHMSVWLAAGWQPSNTHRPAVVWADDPVIASRHRDHGTVISPCSGPCRKAVRGISDVDENAIGGVISTGVGCDKPVCRCRIHDARIGLDPLAKPNFWWRAWDDFDRQDAAVAAVALRSTGGGARWRKELVPVYAQHGPTRRNHGREHGSQHVHTTHLAASLGPPLIPVPGLRSRHYPVSRPLDLGYSLSGRRAVRSFNVADGLLTQRHVPSPYESTPPDTLHGTVWGPALMIGMSRLPEPGAVPVARMIR